MQQYNTKKVSIFSTLLLLMCASFLIASCTQSTTQAPPPPAASTQVPNNLPFHITPPTLGNLPIHLYKLATAHFNTASSVPLSYHKGPVMRTTSTTYAIFWEPSHLQDGFPTHVSATYNSLIERYFQDIGGSGVYANNTQYYDNGGSIVDNSTFGGAWVDTSSYPAPQCFNLPTPHGCMSDQQYHNEVTKAMQVNHWTGGVNHLFFVFTSWGEGSCADITSCAFRDYCAYHSYYTSGGQSILYANMPYTLSLPEGCKVKTSPNNDFDADSTISVISHEHMEAVTDPQISAWYDSAGNEIGDKCAWNFGSVSLDGNKANVQWNGHYYIVQQEWSNAINGCTLKG